MSKTFSAVIDRFYAAARDREGNSIAARLIRGTSGTAFLKMFNMAAVFATTVLLGRFLGVEEFGIYAYAISWITLLGVFAQAGIANVMYRNVAVYHQENDWSRIRGMFRFSLIAVSVASLLGAMVLAVVAWFLHNDAPDMRNALWLACLVLLLKAFLIPFSGVQRGLQQVTYAQAPFFFVLPLAFLLMVIGMYILAPALLTSHHAILLRAAAIGVSLFIAIKLLNLGLKKAGGPQSLPKPVYQSRQWLASAAPMVLVGSMFLVNTNADILMLGSMVGAEAAGVYKAATRGAELIPLSLTIVNVPLGPIIARLYAQGDKVKLQRALTRCTQIAFIPAAFVAAFFIVKGEWFLQIFGNGFASNEGNLSLAILSIGQLVNVATGPVAILLIMTKHEGYTARALTASAVLNVILNATLIPIAGLTGAAIATGISTIVWNVLLLVFVLRHLQMNPTVLSLGLVNALKKV